MRYTMRIEAVSLTSVVVVHAKGDSHLEKDLNLKISGLFGDIFIFGDRVGSFYLFNSTKLT